MPLGVYAVTRPKEQPSLSSPATLRPGAIWCFRHTDPSVSLGTVSPSDVFPCYLVYVTKVNNGIQIRFGCTKSVPILELLEEACFDISEPLHDLCDDFDNETELGRNMEHYNKLLLEGLSHVQQEETSIQARGLGTLGSRDFMLTEWTGHSEEALHLELVTWFVIRDTGT